MRDVEFTRLLNWQMSQSGRLTAPCTDAMESGNQLAVGFCRSQHRSVTRRTWRRVHCPLRGAASASAFAYPGRFDFSMISFGVVCWMKLVGWPSWGSNWYTARYPDLA